MFLPENIDLSQSEKYCLSIRLTPNGFSFSIFSPIDKSAFHYQEAVFSRNLTLMENIKKIFFEVNIFAQSFKKIQVTVVSARYTIVPDLYLQKNKLKEIFEFNIHGNSGIVLRNHIEEGSYHVVYDLDEEVYSFLHRNLWNPIFTSYTTHLLKYFNNFPPDNQKKCFVNFHDQMTTIACYNASELLSINSFSSTEAYDSLYNIVNILDKHQFDQNNDRLLILGDLSDNRESIVILKQLIKKVEEITFPDNFNNHLNTGNRQLPTDIYLQQCE